MNKRKFNARIKYLRYLVSDLEVLSATQNDKIKATIYQEAVINGKALIGAMILAYQRADS